MSDVKIYKNTVSVGKAAGIDFKEGEGVFLTVAKDDANNQTDVTIETVQGNLTAAYGFGGESFPKAIAAASSALTSQRLQATSVYLPAGATVTNLHVLCSSAAASVTTTKMGLYDSATVTAPALLASSAHIATLLTSVGVRTAPLSSPYAVTSSGLYYIVLLSDSGTAGNAASTGSGVTGGGSTIISNLTSAWTQTGQSDLPATATPTATGVHIWVAWS